MKLFTDVFCEIESFSSSDVISTSLANGIEITIEGEEISGGESGETEIIEGL